MPLRDTVRPMAGRDPPRVADPDDWFADPDPATAANDDNFTAVKTPPATRLEELDAPDDWLDGQRTTSRAEVAGAGFTVKLGTLLAVSAFAVVLIVLAGLALGGVFSASSKHPATTPTTPSTQTTTQAPSTTPTRPARRALSAPPSTLKPGDQGAQVKLLQRALTRLGYSAGPADGVYGPSTQAALMRFQKVSTLTADGVLGPTTLQALKQALPRSS
jgi:hypothetical protein